MNARRAGAISRRRLRRPWLWIGSLLLLAALILADSQGWLLVRRIDDLAAYHGRTSTVTRVIDGDTLEIDAPDALSDRSQTRVRLWGLDCPEAAMFDRPAEPFAVQATELARSLALNQPVTLWLEAHQTRDTFGRIVAHVELPDGISLNEALLEAGLARADDRWPHSMLVRYAQVELSARRRKVGIWEASR